MDIGFYFKLFLRRLPYLLLFLTLGTAAGFTIADILPPVYTARATLSVESEQIPSDLAAPTVNAGASEMLQRIRGNITTRERLLELSNEFRIYDAPGSPDRSRMTATDIVTDLRKRITIQPLGGGSRRGGSEFTQVVVAFSAPDAGLSARVANELVDQILSENRRLRTGASGDTLDFFNEEVSRLDTELEAKEAEILVFQEENLDALPDSLDFRRSQQAAAQERLQQLERTEATLRDRRERLVSLYETNGDLFTLQNGAAPRSENARQLMSLRQELSQARAVLSESTPRVRMLESQLRTMEELVSAEAASAAGAEPTGNPQISVYELQLADIDAELGSIAQQKTQLLRQMESLQISIDETPRNAVQLQTMQRAYAAIRQQYEQAVASQAQARTGDIIEARSKGQRILLLEAAVVPEEPESPNRTLIRAGGIGLGAGLGIAVVVLLEMMNSSIRRPADLTARLGIAPFGTIPLIRTPGQIYRRRLLMSFAFFAAAVAVPAGLWYVNTEVVPLDLLLDRALDALGLSNVPGLT